MGKQNQDYIRFSDGSYLTLDSSGRWGFFTRAAVETAYIDSSGNFHPLVSDGIGVPVIVSAPTPATAQSGAVTNFINYTPPAAAGRYRLSGVLTMISWTTPATFTIVVTYKDENGSAKTETLQVVRSTGAVAAAVTAVDRWYFELPLFSINNAATAITLSTAGTFTGTPSYDFAAVLERMA